MKIVAGIALFVLLGSAAYAQQAPAAKLLTEATVLGEKIVKGAPFSAEAVNESVQVLADGNRIVRSSTNKLYRNSEGRFRREIAGGSGGSLATFYSVGPGITILDPVVGQRYLLDAELRTARISAFNGKFVTPALTGTVQVSPTIAVQAAIQDKYKAELAALEKARVELKRATAPVTVVTTAGNEKFDVETTVSVAAPVAAMAPIPPVPPVPGVAAVAFPSISSTKYETRTEELGVQNIEGVDATGTRTITTIPAGAIGNERPIEIVYEKWFSNELQLVVMSKNSDPRFGEQTYRLTNIVRSEPDPSLFEVPAGYRVLGDQPGTYTITGKGQGAGVGYGTGSGTGSGTGKGQPTYVYKTSNGSGTTTYSKAPASSGGQNVKATKP